MNIIKKLALFVVAIISFQPAFAGNGEWAELKAFHSVMSKTFHPAEEGKLQPVKDSAANLLAKAKLWQASAVPADYNKDETTKTLTLLVAKCEELNVAVIANKSDADLKKLITEAHEIFHQIVEKCRVHGEHQEGDEHKKEKKSEKKGKKKSTN
ncbi:MAG: hypothetical protein PSX81_10130 [bacterium]|nr:hypothetical protein [bacterium]